MLYLPPYFPDFNPIELAFSQLKTWLRSAQARTHEALEQSLRDVIAWITKLDFGLLAAKTNPAEQGALRFG